MKQKFLLSIVLVGLLTVNGISQNIFNGERVQVVGTFNGYTTAPYGTDYRTTTYRKVSTTAIDPKDGRGQWATTINVAAVSGDVVPINMPGGGGNDFLFISGPADNRFANKWAFGSVKQGSMNGVSKSDYQGNTDMGLNMSTAGYYTFVMNDFGYSANANTIYFVGRTIAAPVNVTRASQAINANGTVTVNITTSATPSTGENIFLRYVSDADGVFSGTSGTSIVQATGSATIYTATIPAPLTSTTQKYYVFTSTSTSLLTTSSEIDKSLSTIRYDDFAGNNYTAAVVLPISLQYFNGVLKNNTVVLSWKTTSEINASGFDVEKLTGGNFTKIGSVTATNNSAGSTYSYTDNSNATSTYRLKLIDKDGTSKYSSAITVNATDAALNSLKLYPTIINDNTININFNQQGSGKATIKVLSVNGKILQQKTLDINAGTTTLKQQLPSLQKGTYIVNITTNAAQKNFTIVVQ
jgi:hypothetical protein